MRTRKLSVGTMLEGTISGALQRKSFGAKLVNLDQYERLMDFMRHTNTCQRPTYGRECTCGLTEFLTEGLAPPSDDD